MTPRMPMMMPAISPPEMDSSPPGGSGRGVGDSVMLLDVVDAVDVGDVGDVGDVVLGSAAVARTLSTVAAGPQPQEVLVSVSARVYVTHAGAVTSLSHTISPSVKPASNQVVSVQEGSVIPCQDQRGPREHGITVVRPKRNGLLPAHGRPPVGHTGVPFVVAGAVVATAPVITVR